MNFNMGEVILIDKIELTIFIRKQEKMITINLTNIKMEISG